MKIMACVVLLVAWALCCAPCKADPHDDALDAVRGKLAAGDGSGALADLGKIGELSPAQSLRARYYLAYALKRQGDLPNATAELLALVPAADTSKAQRADFVALSGVYGEKARGLLASIYNETGQHSKLAPIYTSMIEDYPGNPEWRYLLADSRFSMGRYAEAAEGYRGAVTAFPKYTRAQAAHYRVVEALRSAQRYQEAYDYLASIPQPDTEAEIMVAALRAELLTQYLQRDFDTGMAILEGMIEKYPDHPAIFNCRVRLAYNYLDYLLPVSRRDPGKARAILQDLIKAYPRENMVFEMDYAIAQSYAREGNHEKAVEEYKRLLQQYPDAYPKNNWHASVRYMLSISYRELGRKDLVTETVADLMRFYPHDCWSQLARAEASAK